ncbi:MAG TPA: hypothetical protein VNY27_05840 [Solirubrobacteraceae bacterium]|nr:hypothetical protein [Solirubrobacteraceae bacterium]
MVIDEQVARAASFDQIEDTGRKDLPFRLCGFRNHVLTGHVHADRVERHGEQARDAPPRVVTELEHTDIAERVQPFDRVRSDRLDVRRGGKARLRKARIAVQEHTAHLIVEDRSQARLAQELRERPPGVLVCAIRVPNVAKAGRAPVHVERQEARPGLAQHRGDRRHIGDLQQRRKGEVTADGTIPAERSNLAWARRDPGADLRTQELKAIEIAEQRRIKLPGSQRSRCRVRSDGDGMAS